jgi:flagellar export protein FliJ
MRAFRFRAAAALELRQQQERTAAAAYGRADAALREAQAAETQARRAQADAAQAVMTLQCRGTDIAELTWHRNWIVRCGEIVERQVHEVAARARVAATAEAAWHEARRKLRALERMRERAWRRYQEAQTRLELKQIDELARVRHVLAASEE